MTLPLALRNRLAELILDAFDQPEARNTLEALAAFCRSANGSLDRVARERLGGLGWFEAAGDGRVRLLDTHRSHRAALCGRVAAACAMLGAEAPSGDVRTPATRLRRAARLADHGLYFEVHELLEPAWMRAAGMERAALQALIQIAVGLHHVENGNQPGAISLLSEGLAKLAAAPSAFPLEVDAWVAGLTSVLGALRDGRPCPAAPPWPRPPEGSDVAQKEIIPWRSS